jgi:hypothetical protein
MIQFNWPEPWGTAVGRDVERYAVACGDTTPNHCSAAVALEVGYPAKPCPRVILSSAIERSADPALDELRDDGARGDNICDPRGLAEGAAGQAADAVVEIVETAT